LNVAKQQNLYAVEMPSGVAVSPANFSVFAATARSWTAGLRRIAVKLLHQVSSPETQSSQKFVQNSERLLHFSASL
jgi:hypothetical protein